MKHTLFIVVSILVVLSMFALIDTQVFVGAKLAGLRDTAVHVAYTDSASAVAETSFQVPWRSGIRTLRFRMV